MKHFASTYIDRIGLVFPSNRGTGTLSPTTMQAYRVRVNNYSWKLVKYFPVLPVADDITKRNP